MVVVVVFLAPWWQHHYASDGHSVADSISVVVVVLPIHIIGVVMTSSY